MVAFRNSMSGDGEHCMNQSDNYVGTGRWLEFVNNIMMYFTKWWNGVVPVVYSAYSVFNLSSLVQDPCPCAFAR